MQRGGPATSQGVRADEVFVTGAMTAVTRALSLTPEAPPHQEHRHHHVDRGGNPQGPGQVARGNQAAHVNNGRPSAMVRPPPLRATPRGAPPKPHHRRQQQQQQQKQRRHVVDPSDPGQAAHGNDIRTWTAPLRRPRRRGQGNNGSQALLQGPGRLLRARVAQKSNRARGLAAVARYGMLLGQ